MKTPTTTIQKLLLFCCMLLLAGTSHAQTTFSYQLILTNQVRVSPNIYQFDVFLLNTSTPAGTTLELAGLQFGLGFDTNIVNGGTLTGSIVAGTTEFNAAETPTTVSISTVTQVLTNFGIPRRWFNLAGRTPPG